MENGKKTVYLAAILGFILLIILLVWFAFGRNKVVSPVPDEGIKVIFTSSQPSPVSTPVVTSSPTPTATVKPTAKPTTTPKPSASATASPSASPTVTP